MNKTPVSQYCNFKNDRLAKAGRAIGPILEADVSVSPNKDFLRAGDMFSKNAVIGAVNMEGI